MKRFRCEVYGPKGFPECVTVLVSASSAADAKRQSIKPARTLWWDIPHNPKVIVKELA